MSTPKGTRALQADSNPPFLPLRMFDVRMETLLVPLPSVLDGIPDGATAVAAFARGAVALMAITWSVGVDGAPLRHQPDRHYSAYLWISGGAHVAMVRTGTQRT
eukprot:scaffold97625_cov51-Cyclotella_meneghiniana.AAC.6